MEFNFNVYRVLYFYCNPDWFWDKPSNCGNTTAGIRSTNEKYHWNSNLWCILRGSGNLKTSNGNWPLRRGDIFCLKGGESYSGTHDPQDPLIVAAVHFDFIDKQDDVITPDIPFHHHLNNMIFFEGLLKRVESAWKSVQTDQMQMWMKACLFEFMNIDKQKEKSPLSSQNNIIQKICSEIQQNPAREYNLSEFAQQSHCSQRHFNRLFKQFAGVTPKEYILKIRLEKAKDMLLSSSLSIGQIAKSVGFSDIYYFSKWFKSQTGLPPTKYRL